ncbi:MAG: hypothetical protein ACK58L_06535 [Planctomycetota bacterium]
MSAVRPARSGSPRTSAPHVKLTKYDIVVSTLMTSAVCAVLALFVMIMIWLSNLIPVPVSKQVEMMPAGDGGWEDGDPNATPDVESPEDASLDPSLANEESDVTELEQITEQVMEVAENAASIVAPNEFADNRNTGNPGSAEGKGGRPLGSGGPGRGGAKREQRWYVEFAEKGDLKSYAEQLDFFGIELGCRFPDQGRLVFLSQLSQPVPTQREIREADGDKEKRLFMNWQEGSQERVQADLELFQKAKIDAGQGVIMHFYPAETEQMLAQLELAYDNKKTEEIRRTYFQVRRGGSGYEFVVTKQLLK